MLDRAVLAGRVHRLKYEEQRPPILGVEYVLLLREPRRAFAKQLCGLAFLHLDVARVRRIEIL